MSRLTDSVDAIIVNAAGCGAMLKDYGHLLQDTPAAAAAEMLASKVRDISEFLVQLGPVKPTHPLKLRATYHDACHLGHGQGIRDQPRAVLRTIPRLQVSDIPEAEICCGSAGIYNLVMPEAGEDLGRRKVANVLSVAPDALATANPGCLLQIRRYLPADLPMFHPIELVDASIRGVDPIRTRDASRARPFDARPSQPGTF